MSRDSGGLPVGERIERLEDDLSANKRETVELFKEVFEEVKTIRQEMTDIKIKMAESSVRLALIVGTLSAIASALLGLLLKWAFKG